MEDDKSDINQENLWAQFGTNNSKEFSSFYDGFINKTTEENKSTKEFIKNIPDKEMNNCAINNLSGITFKEDSFRDLDEKNNIFEDLHNYFNDMSFENILEKLNFLIEFYEKKCISKETVVRCFQEENINCYCIPIIKITDFGMFFSCDNKNYKPFLIDQIIEIILQNKLFIIKPLEKNNLCKEEEKNEINEINEIREDTISIKLCENKNDNNCKIKRKAQSIIKNKLKNNIEKLIIDLRSKIEEYEINKENKYKNIEIKDKIKKNFLKLCKNLNYFIYCLIIKKLAKESLDFNGEKEEEEKLRIDIENGENFIKKYFRTYKRKSENQLSFFEKDEITKFGWIIPFYYEDEIKNEHDDDKFILKNVYIAVNPSGFVLIFLLNFEKKIELYNEKKDNIYKYKLLFLQNLNLSRVVKITKLKKLINSNENGRINNYFLISSYNEDTALIINVKENKEVNLEKKYEIEIIQEIIIERGLYSSIEIDFQENNYLLNYHRNFELFFYDENEKIIKSKKIETEKIQTEDIKGNFFLNGPLIKGKNKNFIITLTIFPRQRIEIYNIENNNKNLFLKQIGIYDFNETDNYISRQNNNYFLYKDKYLLLAAFANKSKKNQQNIKVISHKFDLLEKKNCKKFLGGIYIFNIEKMDLTKYIKNQEVDSFNSILELNENTIICTGELSGLKELFKKDRVFVFNIEEKNNEITLTQKGSTLGCCRYINCNNLISKSFFIASSGQNNNRVIEIKNDYKLQHYFNIYISKKG